MIYEYSRYLKVINYDMVRNSSGRLFQYFGEATVKAASAYIDETNGTESFISSHLRFVRIVSRFMTPFDMYSGTTIIYSLVSNAKKTTLAYISQLQSPESSHYTMYRYG